MKFDLAQLNELAKTTPLCHEKHPMADIHIYGYYSDGYKKKYLEWNDTTVHCRGIILDREGNIIERPFPKFWTYRQYISKNMVLLSEGKIFRIPEGNFKIMEKVDGTMCTLYWINSTPYLATQRSFTNVKAIGATKILHEKYSHLFNQLDRTKTYVFEAIYPETKVLIDYGQKRDLYLIGIIDKITGELLPVQNIGFPTCKDYTEEFSHIKDFDDLCALDIPNKEGFVLYFPNNNMIKLKFPWYQIAHRLTDYIIGKEKISFYKLLELNSVLNKKLPVISTQDVERLLKKGDGDLYEIRSCVPSFYWSMGFHHWLEEQKEKCHSAEQGEVKYINEFFDIEKRIEQPHIYETTMWEWEKRYSLF